MNNNSKVLALKYRPQTFDDLIGQEVVAETITNSIKADKIPNAYLFTGIRGIGKTTTARIVAKGLNCLNGITSFLNGTVTLRPFIFPSLTSDTIFFNSLSSSLFLSYIASMLFSFIQ